jgi:hypothetical protein
MPASNIVGCANKLRFLAQAKAGFRLHNQKGQRSLAAFEHSFEVLQIDCAANRREERLPGVLGYEVSRHRFLDHSGSCNQRRGGWPRAPEEIAIREIVEATHRRLMQIQDANERARNFDKVVVGEIASGSSFT